MMHIHAYVYTVCKEDIETLSVDELSEHLTEDKNFPAREIELLEGT